MTESTISAALLLALLFAGHAIADFLLQTKSMVQGKSTLKWLGLHIMIVLVTHLVVLGPLLSRRVAAAAVVIATTHLVIDAAKTWTDGHIERARRAPVVLFIIDQALHAAVLIGAWLWLIGGQLPAPSGIIDPARATWLAWCVAGYAFNANGVGSLIAHMLRPLAGSQADQQPGRGRLIGILERTLILTLLLIGEWGAIGFVLAAKSIARFEELKIRDFAEYYLIGTLISVLFAIGTGLAILAIAP